MWLQDSDLTGNATITADPLVGAYDTPGIAYSVAVSGGYAYVADEQGPACSVVDVTDPANPFEVGFYDTPGTGFEVAVSGGYAYVADYDFGLRVVDVTDPPNPSKSVSTIRPEMQYGVAVFGGYAYVADGQGGLRVVDVSDPSNPVETGFYDTPGYRLGRGGLRRIRLCGGYGSGPARGGCERPGPSH